MLVPSGKAPARDNDWGTGTPLHREEEPESVPCSHQAATPRAVTTCGRQATDGVEQVATGSGGARPADQRPTRTWPRAGGAHAVLRPD
jgi:hypothetical protein